MKAPICGTSYSRKGTKTPSTSRSNPTHNLLIVGSFHWHCEKDLWQSTSYVQTFPQDQIIHLPVPEDLFTKLNGGIYFAKPDLAYAYLQMEIDEESKNFLTINTYKGLFQFNRLHLWSGQLQHYSNNGCYAHKIDKNRCLY